MTKLPFKLDIRQNCNGNVITSAGPVVLFFNLVDGELVINEANSNIKPSWKFFDAVVEMTRRSFAEHNVRA